MSFTRTCTQHGEAGHVGQWREIHSYRRVKKACPLFQGDDGFCSDALDDIPWSASQHGRRIVPDKPICISIFFKGMTAFAVRHTRGMPAEKSGQAATENGRRAHFRLIPGGESTGAMQKHQARQRIEIGSDNGAKQQIQFRGMRSDRFLTARCSASNCLGNRLRMS